MASAVVVGFADFVFPTDSLYLDDRLAPLAPRFFIPFCAPNPFSILPVGALQEGHRRRQFDSLTDEERDWLIAFGPEQKRYRHFFTFRLGEGFIGSFAREPQVPHTQATGSNSAM